MATKRGPFAKPPGRIEQAYRREVQRLLDRYFHLPTAADLGEISARLVQWGQVTEVFRRYAERAASSMVTGVAVQNANSWRQAASQSTRGAEIYAGLRREMRGPLGAVVRARVKANADLISSLPRTVALASQKFIAAEQMKGQRSSVIASQLRARVPGMTRAKSILLARTGVASSETAVTRARAQGVGLNWYEWGTSEDARVRSSHELMDGVLVCWDDPPAPEALAKVKSSLGHYHAGEARNCRCHGRPLVQLDEVSWPHRVYYQGRITRMTKPQFLKVAPGYKLAA